MHFDNIETIWNCRKPFENNVSKACILMIFEAIGTAEKKCNKDSKLCIVTVLKRFGTAQKSKQKRLIVHSDGIWNVLWTFIPRRVGAHPHVPFLLHFWVFHFVEFLEKVVGPDLQGLHVATPVQTISFDKH